MGTTKKVLLQRQLLPFVQIVGAVFVAAIFVVPFIRIVSALIR
jgi:hypothetical protein